MGNKIYAIIVVYNKNVSSSASYNCVKKLDDISIIVCDNSTKDFDNERVVLDDGHKYISMNGNKGLSKAYNKALDMIRNKTGWVCIFDDDTYIPDEYFLELEKLIASKKFDIIMPRVLCENGIMSPVILKKYAVNKLQNFDKVDKHFITGINSGVAINLKFLVDYFYDERLFLDFVDFKFFLDMRKKSARICVMKTQLNQSFSEEIFDFNSAKNRYAIKKKDLKYFYSKTFFSRIFCCYILAKNKIKLALKFKRLSILFW